MADTAKLPVTVPAAEMEHVGVGVVANNGLFDDKVQLRALPVANPPPNTITVPSAVPKPTGARSPAPPSGNTSIVGAVTFWNPFTRVTTAPTLGNTVMSLKPVPAVASTAKAAVTDPPLIEQKGAGEPANSPPGLLLRMHVEASDLKPTPVTETCCPVVPIEGLTVSFGETVKVAVPESKGVPLAGQRTVTVYEPPPEG